MELTFQDQYTQAQNLTQDASTAALTFLKLNINIGQRKLETELSSFYTEETATDLTEDGINYYPTPARFVRLKIAYVTVDSVNYVMEEVHDEVEWQAYQASNVGESDIQQKIIVRKDRYEVFPTPATDDNTITLRYEAISKELQYADYTDGTITTLTNGATAVTASGTTFTAAMAGRYFKIDDDGVWYKIATFLTATTLTLDKPYEGTSIAAGTSTYTIGQVPITPADTHIIPVYYAVMQYFQGFKHNKTSGAYYKSLFDQELKRAKATYSRRYSSKYLPPSRGSSKRPFINPNWYPTIS